jgi:hypothetical protein
MSKLDDLPADQRAALSLLLRQRKDYAEVAQLLQISVHAVHDRAHAALAMLAPREARELTPQGREEIGDYLLGQGGDSADRLRARSLLEGSPAARAWAQALVAELAPLAAGPLPEIPAGELAGERNGAAAPARAAVDVGRQPSTGGDGPGPRAPVAHAPADGSPDDLGSPPATREGARLPSSRVGGAIVLALIVAAVVAVVLVTSGGGSSHHSTRSTASKTSAAAASSKAVETNRIPLTTGNPGSKTLGLMLVFQEHSTYAYFFAAEHLPPSHGFFYALWLYNSPTSSEALNRVPSVGSNGRVQGEQLLPANAANYHRVILTRETSEHPARPGPIVLQGAFALH